MDTPHAALHSHLSLIGCARDNRPDEGSASWLSSSDLFGAGHEITLSWDGSRIKIARHTHLPHDEKPHLNWMLVLEKPAHAQRWQLTKADGSLFSDASRSPLTIASALKSVQKEVRGLGVGCKPGWGERPSRSPRP